LSLPELKFSDTLNGRNKPLDNYSSSAQKDGIVLKFSVLKLFRVKYLIPLEKKKLNLEMFIFFVGGMI